MQCILLRGFVNSKVIEYRNKVYVAYLHARHSMCLRWHV